jgi:hypothetical protein
VWLSWWLQICGFLAEEFEAVDEARPPRRMDGTSGFHRRHDEMSMLKLLWGRVTPFMYVRLEEDGPVVEEFRRLLWPAAGHAFRHGTSLATTAQFLGWLTLAPLSVCDAVVFYFCALLACVFCVVVFVSARYVKLFPLLI